MGQAPTETLSEIEQTRDRIAASISTLERKLPATARAARTAAGVAMGGGAAGTLTWMVVRRAMKRKKARTKQRERTEAIIQVFPEQISQRISDVLEDGEAKRWAMSFGVTLVVLRMLELRRMRALTRALASR